MPVLARVGLDVRLGIEGQGLGALDRHVHWREGRDDLRYLVLEHLEIVDGQVGYRLALLVCDHDIKFNGLDAAPEDRRLILSLRRSGLLARQNDGGKRRERK
jgi:hypothetical protein